MSHWIVPVFLTGVCLYGLIRRVDVFGLFLEGAAEGLKTAAAILPPLIAVMTGVAMCRASGVLELLSHLAAPVLQRVGFPAEALPLALLRPVSGSGALGMLESLLGAYGADSRIGRVASVLQGSTETTFYVMAVYYGRLKITKTGHTLPAALAGDLMGCLMSGIAVTLIFG